jgi:UDP-2,4-diacetamido-2,4,6-trideoxy-beta-L-altropyranose hydrolase
MGKLIILTEAGGDVGYGHLTRCKAIMQAYGRGARLVVHPHSDDLDDAEIACTPWRDSTPGLFADLDVQRSVVLVDSYLAGSATFRALRGIAPFLAVLDDYGRLIYDCDLVINPALRGPDLSKQAARVVSGADWLILREPIRRCPPKKTSSASLKRLLVSFGGADRHGLFQRLIPVLIPLAEQLLVLAGTDARAVELRGAFPRPDVQAFGRIGAEDICTLFRSCDLAVSAGGQTLNELAYLGVPFLAVETGEDQHNNIAAYVAFSVTPEHLYASDPLLEKRLIDLTQDLQAPERRAAVTMRSSCLIDGEGAARIASLLREAVAHNA